MGGAFQLTPAGLQRLLRACTALRSLAADGSTIQDAAFSGLLGQPEGAAAGSRDGGGGAEQPGASAAVAPFAARRWRQPGSAPLQQLERLSLRGCLFLRGSLLGDLAAACPALARLDLAGCGLALKCAACWLGWLRGAQLCGHRCRPSECRHPARMCHAPPALLPHPPPLHAACPAACTQTLRRCCRA